jgi:hypothetical protein
LCLDQHSGGIREAICELLDDRGVLGMDLFGIGLFEDRSDECAHHRVGGLRHPGVHVPDEVHPTTLPGGTGQHRGDGVDQALVGVGDDQRELPDNPSVNDTAVNVVNQ